MSVYNKASITQEKKVEAIKERDYRYKLYNKDNRNIALNSVCRIGIFTHLTNDNDDDVDDLCHIAVKNNRQCFQNYR